MPPTDTPARGPGFELLHTSACRAKPRGGRLWILAEDGYGLRGCVVLPRLQRSSIPTMTGRPVTGWPSVSRASINHRAQSLDAATARLPAPHRPAAMPSPQSGLELLPDLPEPAQGRRIALGSLSLSLSLSLLPPLPASRHRAPAAQRPELVDLAMRHRTSIQRFTCTYLGRAAAMHEAGSAA